MVIEETKTTKRIRIIQCILFLFEIILLTLPYIGGMIDGKYRYFTCIDLIFGNTENQMPLVIRLASVVFLIIPIVGFFAASFDKTRNIKNIIGIAGSGIGVCAIVIMIGGEALALGSMLSLLLYLITFFVSMLGVFSRILPNNSTGK
ncbi:MAG: hypothetical protein ACI4IS_06995 [Acutalibacteraceae bacterium]